MFGRDIEFADRAEAGRRLAEALAARGFEGPLVICALPRGGAAVAAEVARRLGAPLDLVLVRKLPAPGDPEYAMGAVAEGDPPAVVLNPEAVPPDSLERPFVKRAIAQQLAEIARRRNAYLGDVERPALEGRTAIVVDDGLATGSTARAAARSLRARGARRLVLAVPVAPPSSLAALRGDFDETVCLHATEFFLGVGGFYREFHQLTDVEVVELMRSCRASAAPPAKDGGLRAAEDRPRRAPARRRPHPAGSPSG